MCNNVEWMKMWPTMVKHNKIEFYSNNIFIEFSLNFPSKSISRVQLCFVYYFSSLLINSLNSKTKFVFVIISYCFAIKTHEKMKRAKCYLTMSVDERLCINAFMYSNPFLKSANDDTFTVWTSTHEYKNQHIHSDAKCENGQYFQIKHCIQWILFTQSDVIRLTFDRAKSSR